MSFFYTDKYLLAVQFNCQKYVIFFTIVTLHYYNIIHASHLLVIYIIFIHILRFASIG